jgi:hypothetical protein
MKLSIKKHEFIHKLINIVFGRLCEITSDSAWDKVLSISERVNDHRSEMTIADMDGIRDSI